MCAALLISFYSLLYLFLLVSRYAPSWLWASRWDIGGMWWVVLPHLDHIELGDAILLHTHGHGDAVLFNEHGESWRSVRGGGGKLGRRLSRKWGREGQRGRDGESGGRRETPGAPMCNSSNRRLNSASIVPVEERKTQAWGTRSGDPFQNTRKQLFIGVFRCSESCKRSKTTWRSLNQAKRRTQKKSSILSEHREKIRQELEKFSKIRQKNDKNSQSSQADEEEETGCVKSIGSKH